MDLLENFLALNPKERITAKIALEHPYFKSNPLPCLPESLPKIEVDAHEYQVNIRLDNERLKRYEKAEQKAEIINKASKPFVNQTLDLTMNKRFLPQQAACKDISLEPMKQMKKII